MWRLAADGAEEFGGGDETHFVRHGFVSGDFPCNSFCCHTCISFLCNTYDLFFFLRIYTLFILYYNVIVLALIAIATLMYLRIICIACLLLSTFHLLLFAYLLLYVYLCIVIVMYLYL